MTKRKYKINKKPSDDKFTFRVNKEHLQKFREYSKSQGKSISKLLNNYIKLCVE